MQAIEGAPHIEDGNRHDSEPNSEAQWPSIPEHSVRFGG